MQNQLETQLEIYQQIIAKQAEINALIEQLQALNPDLAPTKKKPSKRFEIPSIREIKEHIDAMGYYVDAEQFHAFYSSKDWMIGKNKMKNWEAALVTWNKRSLETRKGSIKQNNPSFLDSLCSDKF